MKWALVGEITKPYKITESELLGEIVMTPHEPLPLEQHPGFTAIGEKFPFLDRFQISLISFKPNIREQRTFLYPNFDVVGAVAYDVEKVIGIAHDKYLVIDKNYRGMQLGCKLLAEQYLAVPDFLENRKGSYVKRYYTPSGLKVTRGAYYYLLEHGAVTGE